MENNYSDITPEIRELTKKCVMHNQINPELYGKYDVKRGLRDINGKGVLAGLTEISEVRSSVLKDGVSVPCDGELFYRGINVKDIIDGFVKDKRFGFEEIVYLLLYGELPSKQQLDDFSKLLGENTERFRLTLYATL